ncbi:Lysine histidine transporter 1 [Dichanthelium oligosanthes]|uniref:Lysine histidine transporter 1 n=1 Tax=Dichanthelium oligosanthes TaxID=888268 RepID=A0A1E5V8X0_9POAL|nr:Lysine histidine transporter 1 [Dichanthelium oligosanthes]
MGTQAPENHFAKDERSAGDKAIDDWLPITSSRNAKWWYSAFHNVTAMVGAGVLSFPYAMSELGWGPGTTVLILSWIITLYTMWQMVEMHEMVPGKRFDRYHELGQHAFGKKLGLWIVVPQQLVVEVGGDIVFMVTGGKSLKKFHDVICDNNYSTIAWGASAHKGKLPNVDYHIPATTTPEKVFGFFGALGDVAFAYAGHNVVLEIQATIPSTLDSPSKKPMWKGVIGAYIIVAICYFPVSFIGYWAFGNQVDDNILITLNKPKWLIALANMMVVIHVIGSYQIFAMPVFDMIETILVKKLRFPPGLALRLIARTTYVAFTTFIAITIPFFGGLLGFFGGFAFAPTTYFVSPLIHDGSSREQAIDNWLPINASRNAKWWYSAFHNVTAMVGAGVLGLPYAMSRLGWGAGITVMILSWIITLYTLWQMVEMHEMVPGRRFDRYHELGQYAFGEKLGLWIVVPQQLVVEVGVNIVYMVTGGQSLKKFHDVICPDCKNIKLTYFIMIFASAHFVLSQLPNFNSISGVSLAAAVMSLSYSTIAWGASVDKGKLPNVDYSLPNETTPGKVFGFLGALGTVAFAYAGHNVVLEIQATIPSTPEKPSKKPMWRGVVVAYIVVALCYFPVSFVGYWAFGNRVDSDILITLSKPRWLIALANMMVVIHVIGSYQIYAMPVFDMIETVLVKRLKFPPGLTLRLIARTVYVAFTMFVAITFPFFDGLLSFFGGFAFAPTTYFLPCIMWLAIYKPKRFSLSWFANWICIVLGVLLMILAPIGGLRNIILQANTYKFYQ